VSFIEIVQPSIVCIGSSYWTRMWEEITAQILPSIQWINAENISLSEDLWKQKNVLMRIYQQEHQCVLEDWITCRTYALPEFFSVFLGELKQLESAKGYKSSLFALYQYTLISQDNQRCVLREKEYAMFVYCMSYYGKPIHKDVLLKEIWHYTQDIETSTLETHIAQLNKKLAPCGHRILRERACYTLCGV
jgi:hypothetical protein